MNKNFTNYQWLLIGSNIVSVMLVSVGLGYWLDKKLNTKPKILLIMLGVSIIHVFLLFWRIVKNIEKRK